MVRSFVCPSPSFVQANISLLYLVKNVKRLFDVFCNFFYKYCQLEFNKNATILKGHFLSLQMNFSTFLHYVISENYLIVYVKFHPYDRP